MSLVVLSNNQSGYDAPLDEMSQVVGIQRPNSFHNALSNTITLPPHSEVGVVSTKIFRRSKVVIGDGNRFFVYFGKLLGTDANNVPEVLSDVSVNMPIPVSIRPGTYEQEELKVVLSDAISEAFGTHPNMWYFGCDVSKPITGGLPTPVAGGMSFTITQTSRASVIPGGAVVVQRDIKGDELSMVSLGQSIVSDDEAVAYTSVNQRITRQTEGSSLLAGWDNSGVGMIKNAPISMNGGLLPALNPGTFCVNIENAITNPASAFQANEGWRVGLSRPEVRSGMATCSSPPCARDADDFYDLEIEYDGATEELSMYHVISDGNMRRRQEITYWGADVVAIVGSASGAKITSADMAGPYGAGTGTRLHFTIEGEAILIKMTDSVNANIVTLMDTTATAWAILGLSRAVKPFGQSCCALYPKFDISTKDQYFTLVNYEVPMPATHQHHASARFGYHFPEHKQVNGDPEDAGLSGISASSYWGKAIYNTLYRKYMNDCDLDSVRYQGIGAQIAYQVRDTSTLVAGAKIDQEAINYRYAILLNSMSSNPAINNEGEYPNDGSGNCRGFLAMPSSLLPGNLFPLGGFNHQGTLSDTSGADPNTGDSVGMWKVNSLGAVDYNPKQMFLKCSSLTHQSFNFCKGLPSKILWSLPRFSNDGVEFGPLYYQQESPIYLALNNVNPLVINDLDIEFVDKDERAINDLGGETVVVLHFKKGHSCK
jgi:hypothetical protein